MASYQVRLEGRETVAEGTMAFRFEKPPGFQFKAGQFVRVTLIDPPETDDEGDDRSFSIASAPSEPDLIFATRMRDTAFKRVLKAMPEGGRVRIDGPLGKMVLPDEATRPCVFLTGGIGITPFRSMIVQATRDRAPHHLFLFYSNRRPEDAAFLDELKELQGRNRRYVMVATMTDLARSSRPWSGESSRLTNAMLAKYLGEADNPLYYVVGPPGLVDAMRQMLAAAGISTADIRLEKFAGY